MNLYCEIKAYKQTEKGAEFKVFVPDVNVGHVIQRYRDGGKPKAELRIDDGRTISADQRKKTYATLRDICLYTGYQVEELKDLMKLDYIAATGEDYFSLSNCSVTTSRFFINHLIEFCFMWEIPFLNPPVERTDDIDTMIFLAIKYRQCILCRNPADLHHVTGSRVGMGSNRTKISHSGRALIPLCREHHNKVHIEGEVEFFELHHVYGIVLDDETLKSLGYKVDEIENHEEAKE
jgi:hypothetical protein